MNNFAQLNQLCLAFEKTGSTDQVEHELNGLLQAGECSQARVLLDAAELRLGPWLAVEGMEPSKSAAKVQLGAAHLTILLSEDDLPAARLLTKRLGGVTPVVIQRCVTIYQRLWTGDTVGAIEVAVASQKDAQFGQFPLALKALELFIARIRNRQLQLLQRAYSAIAVDSFGKSLGLSSKAEVESFCKWSPNLFEVKGGYVLPAPVKPVENEDVGAQIEKLTKLTVFLEGETVTYINAKVPTTATSSSSSQQ